ncbi:glycosyltransferase, partial [Alphaproteobacteria bacterium]|nr:glycosyltransferase [Alphaproteobacteria bacterium]
MQNFTVLIPTKNRYKSLLIVLNSLNRQKTKKPIDIYIGNNGDKNLKISQDKFINLNIKIFNHKKDIGFAKNLSFLISKVVSKYFLITSDDDYYISDDMFNKIEENFNSDKNLAVQRVGFLDINIKNNFIKKKYFKNKSILFKDHILKKDEAINIINILDGFSGIFFNKNLFQFFYTDGVISCYFGNVLQNIKDKHFLYIDKPYLLM